MKALKRLLPHFDVSVPQSIPAPGTIEHIAGLYGSASAAWGALCISQNSEHCHFFVLADEKSALDFYENLQAFNAEHSIALLPDYEASPFSTVNLDRNLLLRRTALMAQLATGQLNAVVLSVQSLMQKVAPARALVEAGLQLEVGSDCETRALGRTLDRGGYRAVPVVEDIGTFCIRGEIIDLWPLGEPSPYRIELDFEKIASITAFDAESQRKQETLSPAEKVLNIYPARGFLIDQEAEAEARRRLRLLTDKENLPSSKARLLIDDVASGHFMVGGHGYLPAFFDLESLTSLVASPLCVTLVQPDKVSEAAEKFWDEIDAELSRPAAYPRYALEDHIESKQSFKSLLEQLPIQALHHLAISGSQKNQILSSFANCPENCRRLETSDQGALSAELAQIRKTQGAAAGLAPLCAAIQRLDARGVTTVISSRTKTQAERLSTLLINRSLRVESKLPERITQGDETIVYVIVSSLNRGFLSAQDEISLLAEEEIFGRRRHNSSKSTQKKLKNSLDDLRSLKKGDLIVHSDHGIGRYLGLQHREVGGTQVDLLVVEYHTGDKLFLPVYRLNQVQKYSGKDASPKLDRLGGQTFAKAKSRAKKKVKELADQLLKLYAERAAVTRPPLEPISEDYLSFCSAFAFEETRDQAQAIDEVIADLQKPEVMDRLICGDVGFGKTEVALRATFYAVDNGKQAALLCPTTVLAEQHFRTFQARFENTGARVRVLSRFSSKKEQFETLKGIKEGSVDLVIGTHRLLSKDVHFRNLGLLVVDEEQRFGVTHKERIKEMRRQVDVLTLSATPIPRTLSLAISGLRDFSLIQTPPEARRSIRTFIARHDEHLIREAITRELDRGGQAYYVYNRVEGLYERAALLTRLIPGIRVGVVHGQLSETELEKTMLRFVSGEMDVLVATSIIESGLDISRANTMLVDRADLFGLSQLYQIRGRVGRSKERAYCYLLLPNEESVSDEAKARVDVLARHSDLGSGFQIATQDMELRGAGDFLGAEQSGFMTRVGFELFSQMLEEATAELRGEDYSPELEPELSLDVEALLPEEFIADIGLRLSFYKRYASCSHASDVEELNAELQERFGEPPESARRFMHVMRLKTELKKLRALGLTATGKSATLHLALDTPLKPELLLAALQKQPGRFQLSPDGRIHRRLKQGLKSGLEHAEVFIDEMHALI